MIRPKTPRHPQPLQPIVRDSDGVIRFQSNAIVQFIVEQLVGAHQHGSLVSKDKSVYGYNDIMAMPWSDEDRDQFNQLHGYSVSGLPWRSRKRQAEADQIALEAVKRRTPRQGAK